MSPEMTGIIGILIMFLLLALRMYIGIAMSIVGFLGLWYLMGLMPQWYTWNYTIDRRLFIYTECYTSFVLWAVSLCLRNQYRHIKNVNTWMGHFKGGLAMATILACAVLPPYAVFPCNRCNNGYDSHPRDEEIPVRQPVVHRLRCRRWNPGHTYSSKHRFYNLWYPDRGINRQAFYGRFYSRDTSCSSLYSYYFYPVHN